jgi:hypothetical protein
VTQGSWPTANATATAAVADAAATAAACKTHSGSNASRGGRTLADFRGLEERIALSMKREAAAVAVRLVDGSGRKRVQDKEGGGEARSKFNDKLWR